MLSATAKRKAVSFRKTLAPGALVVHVGTATQSEIMCQEEIIVIRVAIKGFWSCFVLSPVFLSLPTSSSPLLSEYQNNTGKAKCQILVLLPLLIRCAIKS